MALSRWWDASAFIFCAPTGWQDALAITEDPESGGKTRLTLRAVHKLAFKHAGSHTQSRIGHRWPTFGGKNENKRMVKG